MQRASLRRRALQPASVQRELLLLIAVAYVACVLAVVIVPVPMTRMRTAASVDNNFEPLVHTIRQLRSIAPGSYMKPHVRSNILGNILMFVPAGVLIPLCLPVLATLARTTLVAFLLSICIELAQLVSRTLGVFRSVDVDDVILNTIGAVIGFAIYAVCVYLSGLRRSSA